MDPSSSWRARFDKEINQAETARLDGNEGKARVCARRAAGVVVHEYLRRQGTELSNPSAYILLKAFLQFPQKTPAIREIVGHFLLRITPDHDLPVDADLIAEARWLAEELMP
jgi:hypothetical protein